MASEPKPVVRTLSVPDAPPAHFSKNYIRQAVCELRFPTLFEIAASDRPPPSFAKALRREYPIHEFAKNLNINLGGIAQASAHIFRSKGGRWNVTLSASTVSIETSKYDSFNEFNVRIRAVVEACKSFIDSDIFTRIGLRYVNALPLEDGNVDGWVNPSLVQSLSDGVFGDVEEFSQTIRGATEIGGYAIRHGISVGPIVREYVLDYDFYNEFVSVQDAISAVSRLHRLEFSTFAWSLGPKAKTDLGPSV